MKNVLFWVGVKSKDPLTLEKHGNFEYFEYSKKTWEYWCYGAQSGTEFYLDFPKSGINKERCLYCVKEMKNAIQFKVKNYKSQHRLKQLS